MTGVDRVPWDQAHTCTCGGDSRVLAGAPGEAYQAPPPHARAPGDAERAQRLPYQYYLRQRGCQRCGATWSTVEVNLEALAHTHQNVG